MFALLLLTVIGTAALGTFIFDDDDTSVIDEDSDQELNYDGSETLLGAEGDDTLSAGQDPLLTPSMIDLMGGNDTAVVEHPLGTAVFGGEGDDTLTSTSVGNTLSGDDGNDMLFGIDANDLYGGAGDDEITFDSDVELNDATARIDGGEGDDTINIFADAGVDNIDRGGAIVTGGEGNDDFNITLDLMNSQFELSDNDGLLESNIVRLADFDPAEDNITIEIARDDETEDRAISAINFDQTETDGEFTTELSLVFEATDTALEAASNLTITSRVPFTLANITLVNV